MPSRFSDLDRYKTLNDGFMVSVIEPNTEVKKKNRRRHVKDGCPKSERGKSHLIFSKVGEIRNITLDEIETEEI